MGWEKDGLLGHFGHRSGNKEKGGRSSHKGLMVCAVGSEE